MKAEQKIKITVTYDLNVWWPDKITKLLEALPGIRKVDLIHVYKTAMTGYKD